MHKRCPGKLLDPPAWIVFKDKASGVYLDKLVGVDGEGIASGRRGLEVLLPRIMSLLGGRVRDTHDIVGDGLQRRNGDAYGKEEYPAPGVITQRCSGV